MKLSLDSINVLAGIMLGTTGLTYCLQKSEVDVLLKQADIKGESFEKFFENFSDIKKHPQYKNKHFKLEKYLIIKLNNINFTHKLYQVVDSYFSQLYNYTSNIEEVLEKINTEFRKDNYEIVQMEENGEFKIYSLDDSMVNYDCLFKEKELGNYILINQQCEKCIKKIENGDYMGAITNASSLLEQLLQEIIDHNGFHKNISYNSKLKIFIDNVLEALQMTSETTKCRKNVFEKLQKGFSFLTDGLYVMRNTMSDAHRVVKGFEPSKKEALLAVNTSKTIANFIVAEYFEKFEKKYNDK